MSTEWYLKDFKIVWFDPNVNNEENKARQSYFDKKFGLAKYCTTKESALEEIKHDNLTTVLVSNGENYKSIQAEIDEAKNVSRVFIYCLNVEAYKNLKDQSKKKNLIVSDDFKELEEELKKIKDSRLEKFFAKRQERTFYTIDDKEIINNALTKQIENEGSSIFFPIGFKGVDLHSVLWDEKLDEMWKVAQTDSKLEKYRGDIELRLKELKENLTMESIIKSYTDMGLYNFFNLYIRFGEYESLKLFSDYLYCLKGSLIELGVPVSTKSIQFVYRGMSLLIDDLNKWKAAYVASDHVQNFGLFPSFTSTTIDENVADYFIGLEKENSTGKQDRKLVKLCMELTENTDEFCSYLKKFDFVEGCGITFPADISRHSAFPKEKEVLFPPFYPFKICQINEKDGITSIKIVVPKQLCFTSLKGFQTKRCKENATENWSQAFIDKSIELVVNGISTDLTFSNFLFYVIIGKKRLSKSGKLKDLLISLAKTKKITKFGLEYEEIEKNDFDMIFDSLFQNHSSNLLSLSLGNGHLLKHSWNIK